MTTSSDNLPKKKTRDDPEPWEHDTLGDTQVEDEYGPHGHETVYYYVIQDTSFEDAWLKSSESRNLSKMR